MRLPDRSTSARRVLLATGVSDVEPATPHLLDALRSGALRYCPVCDGDEVIDRAVGVITDSARGAYEALHQIVVACGEAANAASAIHLALLRDSD